VVVVVVVAAAAGGMAGGGGGGGVERVTANENILTSLTTKKVKLFINITTMT